MVRIVALIFLLTATAAQAQNSKPKTVGKNAWTVTSLLDALERRPNDAYLTFAVIRLARQGTPAEREATFEFLSKHNRNRRVEHDVDAFSLFTGAHAVQESLQLDDLLQGVEPELLLPAEARPRGRKIARDEPEDEKKPPVVRVVKPTETLQGPTVKSHPWTKMLAGKRTEVSRLAKMTPEDYFLVEFRSLNKLLDLCDQGQDWAAYIFTQGDFPPTDPRIAARYKTQLLLETNPLLRPFYDQVVNSVALVGSDLFLREGSDLTVLFDLKLPDAFRVHADKTFSKAARDFPHDKAEKGEYSGIAYHSLISPDGIVRAYAADPKPDLHVRSNSLPALKRVLDTIQAGGPKSLGVSDEFQYIRTLMPAGAREEDGLVYLSDPFIRNLVGPQVKLIERRRMIGYNHLRMISFGAQLYLTQFGVKPTSLKDLEAAGCVPGPFNEGKLKSPFGGVYSLADDGLTGVCSLLGRTAFLTPGRELPLANITADEVRAYEEFLRRYSDYWTQFFDPIAIRAQFDAAKLRAETLILPLIDNSLYTGMAEMFAGQPEHLDRLPVPAKNLFTINFRVDKAKILESSEGRQSFRFASDYWLKWGTTLCPEQVASWVSSGVPTGIAGHGWGPGILLRYRPLHEDIVNETERTVSLSLPNGSVEKVILTDRESSRRPAGFELMFLKERDRQYYDGADDEVVEAPKKDPLREAIMGEVKTLVLKGLGNQVGLHFYDQRIMFDVNMQNFIGEFMRFGRGSNLESLTGLFVIGSIVSPVYASATVDDAKVVDAFFEKLDALAAEHGRRLNQNNFVSMKFDFHHFTTKAGHSARSYGYKIGPVMWRTYLARIGHGLYITNDPNVIDDLHAIAANPPGDQGPVGHALLRMRAQAWNAALPGYQVGWAQGNREACCKNMTLLSDVARAHGGILKGTPEQNAKILIDLTRRLHGIDCTCPDGGAYRLEPDGLTLRCDMHGTAANPRQKAAPEPNSPIARVMSQLRDMNATLTFLPEGLRAVVVIDRTKQQ